MHAAGQRVGQRLRLLVDLLEHERLVAALLGGVDVPGDLRGAALQRRAVVVGELGAVGGEHDHVAVLHHRHPARVLQERRDGAGDEHLVLAVADHQRRLVAGADDDVRLAEPDGAEGEVALQAADGGAHGAGQAAAVHGLFDEVGDDLGVRLRGERVSAARSSSRSSL